VVCRASKGRLLLVCLTRSMVQEIVVACQTQLKKMSDLGQLSPDAMAFLAVSHLSAQLDKLPIVVGRSKPLVLVSLLAWISLIGTGVCLAGAVRQAGLGSPPPVRRTRCTARSAGMAFHGRHQEPQSSSAGPAC
jgi:hypothetical protein